MPNETPPPPAASSLSDRSRRARVALRWAAPLATALLIGAVTGVGVAAAIHMPRVDSLSNFRPSLVTRLLDDRGETFASYARENRILLDENQVPKLLQNALIASEDQNFFEHGGVDLAAIFRAQLANMRAGQRIEGASTLTMQLARELFLSRERTWRRKIEEAFLAVELEKSYSKQQILTLYLNLVNFGGGNYGVAAAARGYFDKSVDQLDAAEAATLIGILPSPSRYNPYRRADLALERRNTVLRRMRDAGFLTRTDYQAALAEPLQVLPRRSHVRLAAYFAEDVRKHLESTYGTSAVVEGGLTVQTTLDPEIQRDAEDALRWGLSRLDHRKGWRGPIRHLDDADLDAVELPDWEGSPVEPDRWYRGLVLASGRRSARVKIEGDTFELLPEGLAWTGRHRPDQLLEKGDVAWFRFERGKDGDELRLVLEQEPELEGAVVVLESATGAVRAMVGGWDFERSKFNRATQARRQVGSAFKPFVYGAALEAGFTPADTLFDGPTFFPGADAQLSYQPHNHLKGHYGILTLRRALEISDNVAAVKLLDLVGVQRVIDFAHACGIRSELPPYPSLALGTAEIVPLELAAAYATIANQGTYVEPYTLERVASPNGRVLEEHTPTTRAATSPQIAYVLSHMMEGVVDRGTAFAIHDLDVDIAGKTGTTDDYSDAWFAGFTPRYTLLAWVGYDVKRSIGHNMTGSAAALPVWRRIAEEGLEQGWLHRAARFPKPPGVTLQTVDYSTGLLPGPATVRTIDEAFLTGTEPAQSFTPQWASIMELPWYQQLAFYIPKEGERMPDGTHLTDSDELTVPTGLPTEGDTEGAGPTAAPSPGQPPTGRK